MDYCKNSRKENKIRNEKDKEEKLPTPGKIKINVCDRRKVLESVDRRF